MEVKINNKVIFVAKEDNVDIKTSISQSLGLQPEEFYLISNGKLLSNNEVPSNPIRLCLRVFGGKGGFGSMLRAIGAQIEKTTNREACRDLSGRRLRDINEEKRLKNWIDQQAEREKEAADKKQKKLERLCHKPKHEFSDETYDKERSELPERLEDAVSQGLATSSGTKRKLEPVNKKKKNKKALWIDEDLDDLSSTDADSDVESNADTKLDGAIESKGTEDEDIKRRKIQL